MRVQTSACQRQVSLELGDLLLPLVPGHVQILLALIVLCELNVNLSPTEPDLEYEHLSRGVKAAVLRDPGAISAASLAAMSGTAAWKNGSPSKRISTVHGTCRDIYGFI